MKRYIKTIIDKLNELYEIYHKYCWLHKEENISINIIIKDNTINYSLCDRDNNIIDEFIMTFTDRETDFYNYMSIKVFAQIFDHIPINQTENIYYNDFYRPYTKVIIDNQKTIELINRMQIIENKNTIIDSNPIMKKVYKKIPLWNHNRARLTTIGERIKLSKKLTEGLE